MKKLLGVALLGALAVGPVKAQDIMCIPGGDFVCVATQFTLTNGGNTLNFFAMNGATAGTQNLASVITRLAFWGVPDGVNATYSTATYFNWNGSTQSSTNVNASWSDGAFPGGQFINVDEWLNGPGGAGGIATCGGPNSAGPNTRYLTCLADGGPIFSATSDYLLFTFALSSAMTNEQLAGLGWGFFAQGISAWQNDGYPGGSDSFQCASTLGGPGGIGGAGNASHFCGDDDTPGGPQETVPEPATMTLLATGLAGMAAARRRKKNNA